MKRISMAKKLENKSVADGYKNFVTTCKVRNLSEKTILYYDFCMEKFQGYLDKCGITEICDIDQSVINDYILYMKELDTVNDISINSNIRGMRAIIYSFQKLGYYPTFKIGLIKANKKIKETYTEHKLKLLLAKPGMGDFSEYRNWVIVNFLLAAGIRSGELVGIKIEDVDLNEAIVKIKRGKSRSERHILMSKTIVKIITEYLDYREHESKEDYLFCNIYGQKLTENAWKLAMMKYNKRRGVDKTSAHLFRHTFAKMYILNGGNIFRLQKILGHKSIEIVREYVNMFTDDLKADFDDFNPFESICIRVE